MTIIGSGREGHHSLVSHGSGIKWYGVGWRSRDFLTFCVSTRLENLFDSCFYDFVASLGYCVPEKHWLQLCKSYIKMVSSN